MNYRQKYQEFNIQHESMNSKEYEEYLFLQERALKEALQELEDKKNRVYTEQELEEYKIKRAERRKEIYQQDKERFAQTNQRYYETHKDEILEKHKEYRNNNKDKIKECTQIRYLKSIEDNGYYTCACGKELTNNKNTRTRHEKSIYRMNHTKTTTI